MKRERFFADEFAREARRWRALHFASEFRRYSSNDLRHKYRQRDLLEPRRAEPRELTLDVSWHRHGLAPRANPEQVALTAPFTTKTTCLT